MKLAKHSVIPLAVMLISSALLSYQIPATALQATTRITLDSVPTIVRPGDQLTFTGILTTVQGEPVSGATVNVNLHSSGTQTTQIASAETDENGMYSTTWEVQMLPVEKSSGDLTASVKTQLAALYVQFPGEESYSSSRTNPSTISIQLNSIQTSVGMNKKVYQPGESATIAIAFVDVDGNFVDPDDMKVYFNHDQVADKLEKKKTGSYVYVTPPMKAEHNQIQVIPMKQWYDAENEAVTITVIGKTSQGKFGGF